MKTRVVVTQGPIQSLSAAATVHHLERSGSPASNVLVVGGLAVQVDSDLRDATVKCAAGYPWDRVVVLDGEDPATLLEGAKRALPAPEQISEILCVRNWQSINEAVLALAPAARKLAYGDGLGVFDLVRDRPEREIDEAIAPLPQLETAGSLEGIPLQVIPLPEVEASISAALSGLPVLAAADAEMATFARGGILVLAGNLTEAGVTTLRAELRHFHGLIGRGTASSRIVIKPHPRASLGQAAALAAKLTADGHDVLVVADEFAAYPIELFRGLVTAAGRIVAGWSSSAVSLSYLYKARVETKLPLGLAITTLYPHAVRRGRATVTHNAHAVAALESWDGSSLLGSVPIDPMNRLERVLRRLIAR